MVMGFLAILLVASKHKPRRLTIATFRNNMYAIDSPEIVCSGAITGNGFVG
jgi:hypothetical protein